MAGRVSEDVPEARDGFEAIALPPGTSLCIPPSLPLLIRPGVVFDRRPAVRRIATEIDGNRAPTCPLPALLKPVAKQTSIDCPAEEASERRSKAFVTFKAPSVLQSMSPAAPQRIHHSARSWSLRVRPDRLPRA